MAHLMCSTTERDLGTYIAVFPYTELLAHPLLSSTEETSGTPTAVYHGVTHDTYTAVYNRGD